jgi:hypothetical protein
MTRPIGYIHGSKLEPFSPPSYCQCGVGPQQYTYYHKGYRQGTGSSPVPWRVASTPRKTGGTSAE